jgi:hypothetical protein
MSCGNRFVCGMRKFDKHKMSSDRPNNMDLHNETENKLNYLLQQRQQDTGTFSSVVPSIIEAPVETYMKTSKQNSIPTPATFSSVQFSSSHYTPWKTPSSK